MLNVFFNIVKLALKGTETLMKIVTSARMARIEDQCAATGISTAQLMENAGRAVAASVKTLLDAEHLKSVSILAGPGNNGGDGLVAARYLRDGGVEVTVSLCGKRSRDDVNLKALLDRGVPCTDIAAAGADFNFAGLFDVADVVVDAIFGTGQNRAIGGIYARIMEQLALWRGKGERRIVAVDAPSGLDCDTGAADPLTPQADITVALGLPKAGYFQPPGAEKTGRLVVADIGIPPALSAYITDELMDSRMVRAVLPQRSPFSHKGSHGKALVVAGSLQYPGAALLAASGAVRSGAGLVTLAATTGMQQVAVGFLPEITYLPVPEHDLFSPGTGASAEINDACSSYDAVLVGCGLSLSPVAGTLVKSVLARNGNEVSALVVDGDGLTHLARISEWWLELAPQSVITPHPGEMARLTGLTVEAVQSRRMESAREYAIKWQTVVVLKGAFTVVAGPNGACRVSPCVNPILATAGTGDVLAGVILGLLAQGMNAFDAAAAAVFLHGHAAETISRRLGYAGMLASELAAEIPAAINEIKGGKGL